MNNTTIANPAPRAVPAGLTAAEAVLYSQIPAAITHVHHESFDLPTAEDTLFGPDAAKINVPRWVGFIEGEDDGTIVVPRHAVLASQDQATLFLRYNYARHRLARLADAQERRQSLSRARQMILWFNRANDARDALVQANMALVLSMAKRSPIPGTELTEMVAEGNMALVRAIDKFDVGRGFRFSTYACQAILKSFSRLANKAGRYRSQFPVEFDPEMDRSDWDMHRHEMQWDESVDALKEILARNTARLSKIEQTIITERFALITGGKTLTVAEVGKKVGLANDRVRRIQNLALNKIRHAIDYMPAARARQPVEMDQ